MRVRKAGRATRALVRGLGQFALIVTGVLVALALDQHVERHAERALESQYYQRLGEDVRATMNSLRSSHDRFVRAEIATKYLESLLSNVNATPPSGSVLYLATQRASHWTVPTYFRATLDEMMSVGSLRLIRDDEIRGDLLAFYQWELTHTRLWTLTDLRFMRLARGMQYPLSDERFVDACDYDVHPLDCNVDVPGTDPEALWAELRQNPEVVAMLRHNTRDFLRARELLTPQLDRGDALLARLARFPDK
jgi:hypothetical protein